MNRLLALSIAPLLLASAAGAATDTRLSCGIGVGGWVAPLPAGSTDAGIRSSFLLDAAVERKIAPGVRMALWEIGSVGGGTLHPAVGQSASEVLLLSTTTAAAEIEWPIPEQRGSLSAGIGGGALYVHDRVEHGEAALEASGWGPAALVQVVWWGSATSSLDYRVRLGWTWGQTDLPLEGNPGTRLVSDWSRLELGLGLGF